MPKRGKSAAKGAKSKQATASEVEVTIESSELDAVVGEGLHGTEAPLDVGSDAENELNSCEDVGATSGEPNASWHSEDKADGSDGTHQAAAPAEVEVEAEGSAWNRARRESVYADKRGHLQSTSWCQEHYVRLPRPRHRTPVFVELEDVQQFFRSIVFANVSLSRNILYILYFEHAFCCQPWAF